MLSVIIPCYNEGKCIEKNLERIAEYLNQRSVDFELIAVNDGSKDNTREILDKAKQSLGIVIVDYGENRGKGGAVKAGIEASVGEYVLFMDADLSTDLSAIDLFREEILKHDIVIGSRRLKTSHIVKKQPALRKFIGKCCVLITRMITGMKYEDTQCGFKGFKSSVIKDIIKYQTINGWSFDVEYLYIAHLKKYTVASIPVIWENDEDSKVSPFASSIKFFVELFKIKGNKKYYLGKK